MFSIVVPTYNHEAYLAAALDSLRAQTRSDWEAVVVNDGSTDGTAEIMGRYAQLDSRIRCFHKENGGVSSALNEGIHQAQGSWICWLSSDDLFEPEALSVFAEAIERHPDVRFFHGDLYELDDVSGQKRLGPPNRLAEMPSTELQTLSFFSGNYIHGISICIDRALFQQAGGFDASLRYAQDMDMWLRLSALTPLHYIDRRYCVTRVHAAMGTVGFPEACILDSARACVTFLNRHTFPELFPRLDLRRSDHTTQAVQAALRVALNPGSGMYQGVGPVPILLERMEEWIFNTCPMTFREPLLESLASLAEASASLPPGLREPLIRMRRRQPGTFIQRDPLALMAENRDDAWHRGNLALAGLLKRYLAKVAGTQSACEPAPAAGPVACRSGACFIFEPDWHGATWVEVVMSYAIAFEPGEPVALVLVAGPETPSGAVQQGVLELMARAGRNTFADIIVLEDPAELLEIARGYREVHWVPQAGDGKAGLSGHYGERLATARHKLTGV